MKVPTCYEMTLCCSSCDVLLADDNRYRSSICIVHVAERFLLFFHTYIWLELHSFFGAVNYDSSYIYVLTALIVLAGLFSIRSRGLRRCFSYCREFIELCEHYCTSYI